MRKIPIATQQDSYGGWEIKHSFLQEISDEALEKSEVRVHLEGVEAVILTLAELGYLTISKETK